MKESEVLAGRTEEDLSIITDGVIYGVRASALIIQDNMLLVAKSTYHDCYYTVGGAVRVGESSEDAVLREVYEETGYQLEIDRLVFMVERFCVISGQRFHEMGFFYLMKGCAEIKILSNSTSDLPQETLHWLPISDLPNMNLVPKFLRAKSLDQLTGIEHIISREW